jgi:hypothetical protein
MKSAPFTPNSSSGRSPDVIDHLKSSFSELRPE